LFGGQRCRSLAALDASRQALDAADVSFFATRLPTQEHFRIVLEFLSDVLFVDIETTGLSLFYDYLTVVGWDMAGKFGSYVRGDCTDRMFDAFSRAKALVTFNGAQFDVPFLRRHFPDLPIPSCHVDLRFFSRRVGARGGQKHVEETLGIKREASLTDIRGETAPVLWHRYRWGHRGSLDLLLHYNYADVQGLKGILSSTVQGVLQEIDAPISRPDVRRALSAISRGDGGADGPPGWHRTLPAEPAATPSVTLKELSKSPGFTVVGIDLTGSEARPSGWCALDGTSVETRMVASDDELITLTCGAGADLVSVDSPLSLPRGRTDVADSDPGRAEFGITRECERLLRRRGINVYPCLLPSMQRLTARGMRLAARFRSLGIPVIESYPGAAQDIMGIPRKRASLELLALGLRKFGVESVTLLEDLTHDELDAITSAIVGIYFWAGCFEGLGNADEGFLIIPALGQPNRWRDVGAIGISGPKAAGKTTAGSYLRTLGFEYGRYSSIVEEVVRESGRAVTPSALQDVGRELHETLGQRWLGQQVLGKLAREGLAVIDGLRYPEDHAFLRESFGPHFYHLAISTSQAVRRGRFAKSKPNEVFEIASQHQSERGVNDVMQLADQTLVNDGSIAEFLSAVKIAAQWMAERARGARTCQ